MTTTPAAQDWQIPAFRAEIYHEKRHEHALVIPVINEGERIRAQLMRTASARVPVDVVVADGGSTDGALSADVVAGGSVRAVLTKTGPGWLSAQLRVAYAWSLQQGYTGIITIDGNGKDNVDAVSDFVARLREGYDYVQGSRYQSGGRAERTPLARAIGNRLIHAPIMSLAGRHRFTDTTNGFRAYSRGFLLDPRVAPFRDVFVRYELLFYLTARAGQLGYRVCEIPVRRSYPLGETTPTKIRGLGGNLAVMFQLINAVLGKYHPDESA